MSYMKKIILMSIILATALACGKVDLPQHDIPPHLQDKEQEDNKGDEGNNDQGSGDNPGDKPAQPTGEKMTVRFMSYNIGGFKKFYNDLGHYSYPEVAAIINNLYADVIGLNEIYKGANSIDSGANQPEKLATQLGTGWNSYFAYAANTTYGNAVVSSPDYKIVKEWPATMIPKTIDAGERRSMGCVEYEDFVFCVTHLDHQSSQARKDGVKIITDWALANYGPNKTTKPVILLGDMNCIPAEATITEFKKNWTMVSAKEPTFPSKNTCIDYIFVLNNGAEYEVGTSHAVPSNSAADVSKASDHYAIYCDLTFKAQK